MAGIDKIYGDKKQALELKDWLEENKPELIEFLYDQEDFLHISDWYDRPISNFPEWADKWLLKNCPVSWVTEYIRYQYGERKKPKPAKPKFFKKSHSTRR